MIEVYQIATGKKAKAKVRSSVFTSKPFKVGDILQILSFSKEGKWSLNQETQKWEKSCTIFEDILNNYRVEE